MSWEQTRMKNIESTLLSGTLKTFQKAACDDQQVSLRCPAGTCISVLIAQYGNSAKDLQALCPDVKGSHSRNNMTCLWPNILQTGMNPPKMVLIGSTVKVAQRPVAPTSSRLTLRSYIRASVIPLVH
ncbi:hypothetical protein J6590_058978 [Homalodisca vitripennis]|nr:hypothetical protein J6590_058978 [Homalodisca vitripennis]